MRIIFHLGTFKTGTTTFQHTLDHNRARLKAAGVLYPIQGRRIPGRSDLRHLALSHLPAGSARLGRVMNRLLREMDAAGCDRVILSSESWSSIQRFDTLSRVVATLRESGHAPEGVILFRNRHRYARSHYREWTQNWNNRLPFAVYAQRRAAELDYAAVAGRMNDLFRGHMTHLSFEDMTDSVAALAKVLDLPPLLPVSPRNPSLDAVETELWRQLNMRHIAPTTCPGLPALLQAARGLVDPTATEALDCPALALSPTARAAFAAQTGLDSMQVAAIMDRPPQTGPDIHTFAPAIAALLDRECTAPRAP